MKDEPQMNAAKHAVGRSELSAGLADDYWKATPEDSWGCERRCIHCGAGDDAHHSFSCPTNMHPDKQAANIPLNPASHAVEKSGAKREG